MNIYRWLVGYKSRINYWSCSDFADKVRSLFGLDKKPAAATSKEWKAWESNNKNKVGYWIVEEGFDYIQDIVYFIPDVYRNFSIYIKNRYIDKPHYLDTKLKKGEWHEFDTRVLHGLFETLVDFVELEKAQMQIVSEMVNRDNRSPYSYGRGRKYKKSLPSREYGLKYLDWEINLNGEVPHQSNAAREIKELYIWWKDIRPARPDPYDESGWSEYCNNQRENDLDIFDTTKDNELTTKMLDQIHKLEETYDKEDEEMLIRLIKIRKGCWT